VIGRGWLVTAVLLCAPAVAAAQSRVELGVGASWTGGYDAGGVDALETRNPATGSSPLTLFATSPRVLASPGLVASVGFNLTTQFGIEGSAEYTRPALQAPILNDFEGATGNSAESRLKTLVAGGSVLYHFGAARLTPFALAGAGWTRQVDESNVVLVTGVEGHAGGGIRYRLDRHFALRLDGGISVRQHALAFEEKLRTLPRVSGRLVYRW
jgi:hypothetical protein